MYVRQCLFITALIYNDRYFLLAYLHKNTFHVFCVTLEE